MVEPPGTITTSNDHGRTLIREALQGRGHATTKRVLGIDYAALANLGARGGELVARDGHVVRVEPMLDGSGRVSSLLVRADAPAGADEVKTPPSKKNRARGFARLAGSDPMTRTGLHLAERFARTSLPILVIAEPGAGARDLVGGMHAASVMADKPLVTQDAASLRSPIAESPAFVQLARTGGTLYLEGIDELGLEEQSELVGELDHGSLRDVHLVCSAPADVRPLVGTGALRRDLHQILHTATITLPPLRDRTDKVALAERMLSEIAPRATLSAAAREFIEQHPFHGNLLELEAVLEHASALAGADGALEPRHFPPEVRPHESSGAGLGGTKHGAERRVLEEAIRFAGGNMSVAAKRLGVARSTLYRMLERHGMARA